MDVQQLLAFERVAREGSFSRAAVALGLGQPAVSARLQALESAVGGALFTRGRRIALTPLGEGFLPFVRRALETLDDGVAAARLWQLGRRGRIRLGALGSLAGGLMGPVLAELIRTRPDVECTMRSGDHETMAAFVLDGVVDLALIAWPCSEALAASLTPLVRLHEPVVLVAHPRHPLARRRRVTPDDVSRSSDPLLRLRWWPVHDPAITRLAQASGRHVEVPMEAARHLLLAGVGAGFFTRTYIREDLARGALAAIAVHPFPKLFRDSALVRRARPGPLPPIAAAVVDLVREQARRLRLLAPAVV